MFDILYRSALVYDGSGEEPRVADVAVTGHTIAAMGALETAQAHRVQEAQGLWLCPGFIDVHSHSDAYLLIEPRAPSKIWQGVTTEVVGNCGASAAPRMGVARMPSDWAAKKYPGTWSTVAEYRALIEEIKPAVNTVLLVGHNTLRAGVVGYENRTASQDELSLMCHRLEQALDEGARGLSSGLVYAPGCFAPPEEIESLASVVAARAGIYSSHMRSEGAGLIEAIDETIAVGKKSGVRVQISHLKTAGSANWHKAEAAIERIEQARKRGICVRSDRYPYTASCTDLDILLPNWAAEGSRAEILARLRDPAQRARIRDDILEARPEDYWTRVWIGAGAHLDNGRFSGRPLLEAARELGLHPVDAALYLIDRDNLATGGIFFGMCEANLWHFLEQSWMMIGSDASIRAIEGPLAEDFPHPRAYGSFPKFLRAAADGKTVSVPEAIRKMTSLPAEHFGLQRRGRMVPGYAADLVLIDPDALNDTATYEQPQAYAHGVREVVVNGVTTVSAKQFSDQRGGLFL